MTNSLRVLVLSHTYPSEEQPWVTPFIRDYAEALGAQEGCEVVLSTPNPPRISGENVKVEQFYLPQQNTIAHKRLGKNKNKASVFHKLQYIWNASSAAARIMKQFKPHIVHAHWTVPSGLIAYLCTRRSQIPYVITTHGKDVINVPEHQHNFSERGLSHLLTRNLLRKASRVVTTSPSTEEATRALCSSASIVQIPVGFIPPTVSNSSHVNGREGIVFVGDLITGKGPQFLLQAIVANPALREIPVILIGSGPLFEECKRYILDNQLDNVRLKGNLNPKEVLEHMSKGRVFAFPSQIEGFGIVLLEALFCGLTIVGQSTGALPVLQNEFGHSRVYSTNATDPLAFSANLQKAHARFEEREDVVPDLSKYFWEEISLQYKRQFTHIISK